MTNTTTTIHFDRLWREWQELGNREQRIKDHQRERRQLYSLITELLATLSREATVLEIGCGTAIDSLYLKTMYPDLHVIGTDLSEPALELAADICRSQGVSLDLRVANLFQLPFADNSVDLVFSQGVMEHFPEMVTGTREQMRVITPGGYLVVSVPQRYNPYTIFKRRQMARGTWPYGWETEYSAADLRQLAEQVHMSVVKIRGHGYGYWEDYGFSLLPRLIRRLHLQPNNMLRTLGDLLQACVTPVEQRFGHLFMQNVVAVYQKQAR